MPQKYTFFDSVLGFEKFLFNKFLIVEKGISICSKGICISPHRYWKCYPNFVYFCVRFAK